MIPDSNAVNWILSPIGHCVKYVADEIVNAGVLQKSITNIPHIKQLLLIARQKLLENGKDDSDIRHLIEENKFFSSDYAGA